MRNLIIEVSDLSSSNTPVTLEEVKDYMRLRGFQDVDDSPPTGLSDFDFDDTLIQSMIEAAVNTIERYCGISVKTHVWRAVVDNEAGMIEIPYGPVNDVLSVKIDDAEVDYKTTGSSFKYLVSPRARSVVVEYEAGYGNNCPHDIVLAIKKIVYEWYENRQTDKPINLSSVMQYKRAWTWIT